jgi:hypothetical protein
VASGVSGPIIVIYGKLIAVMGPTEVKQAPCLVERVPGLGPLGVKRYKVLRVIDKRAEPHLDPFKISGKPEGRGFVTLEG